MNPKMSSKIFLVNLVIVLLIPVGIIALEIFLSKVTSRWPGLVLLVTAFLTSFLMPLYSVAPRGGVDAGFIAGMILLWAVGNIPTAILLAIYFACRRKRKRDKQLDKMNIQDLD